MTKKTHKFTRNQDGTEVFIVVDKIKSIDWDTFSECTTIHLMDGTSEGVRESIGEVRKVIEDA